MRRSIILAGIALLALPASSGAYDLPRESELKKYSGQWHKVRDCAGKRAPGRNVRRHGIRKAGKVRKASAREVADSIRQLRRHCQPLLVASPPSQPPSGVQTPRAGGELASIRACESGGNYAINTGNGYYGAYQFDVQTWQAAGGSGMPHTASPAEQDRVAASWIAKGHRGAWPNC